MTGTVVAIFATVYLGMIIGGLPFLQLDRAGVALLVAPERGTRLRRRLARSLREAGDDLRDEFGDLRDSTRSDSPLRPAVDAIILDTSVLTLEEVVERLLSSVRRPLTG